MEWLRERRGSIDIAEFSKINKVPMPRVEETLNALVQKGYIKPL
jgi:sugar-specific transcriptional regulator TrmB